MSTSLKEQVLRIFPTLHRKFGISVARAWLRNTIVCKTTCLETVAERTTVAGVISISFAWDKTPEGYKYWCDKYKTAEYYEWRV